MRRLFILILVLTISFGSCTKFLEIDPPSTKIDSKTAFASDAAAIALMTGIYSRAADPSAYSFPSLSVNAGLSADELISYGFNSSFDVYYKNALNAVDFNSYWGELYQYIYTANLMIEGLAAPNGLSAPVKKQLEGEAKFMRAYLYFYLVNLFGDVPLVVNTTYTNNTLLSRTPSTQVYAQMVQDLKDAQALLSPNYLNADLKSIGTNRIRPNKWAATALLAKVYLFKGDHQNAITESSTIINEKTTYQLETLEAAFTISSKETIFALEPSSVYQNTYEGNTFILKSAPNYSHSVGVSDWLYNAFEQGDKRKSSWIGTFTNAQKSYNFAYKYKVGYGSSAQVPVTENQVILRLAEQYLIRAESYIQTDQVSQGIADLNEIRTRARGLATAQLPNPLPSLSALLSKSAALQAVEHERQVEMFTEMGDRWLTLKRMRGFSNTAISRADEIMPAITLAKGGIWNTAWQLYPIPQAELRKDINIIQNHGY